LKAEKQEHGLGVREWLDAVRFDEKGLVPVVVQDRRTGEVLMLAYADRTALENTLKTREGWFYSRSRGKLWLKGETSGNRLVVREVRSDCDLDAVLYLVDPTGPACHTGARTCFFQSVGGWVDGPGTTGVDENPDGEQVAEGGDSGGTGAAGKRKKFKLYGPFLAEQSILDHLYRVVRSRKRERPAGSYVVSLLEKGPNRILQKIGEEATELVLAGKDGDRREVILEMADLWFHCLVLLGALGVPPGEVLDELRRRRK